MRVWILKYWYYDDSDCVDCEVTYGVVSDEAIVERWKSRNEGKDYRIEEYIAEDFELDYVNPEAWL